MVDLDELSPARRARVLGQALLVVAGCVGAVLLWLSRPYRWPSAEGVVLESHYLGAAVDHGGPHLIYEYEVDGRSYRGTRLTQFSSPGRYDHDKTHFPWVAKAFVERHPIGAPIEVRYDPRDPTRAVVWWTLATPGVFVVSSLVAALAAATLHALWRLANPPARGGARAGARDRLAA